MTLRGAVHLQLVPVRPRAQSLACWSSSASCRASAAAGLQPSEQAILADTFPPEKRGMAFAVYGMAVVVAPAIGPTLGGWITDNYVLALDLLHQHSRRHPLAVTDEPARVRPAQV